MIIATKIPKNQNPSISFEMKQKHLCGTGEFDTKNWMMRAASSIAAAAARGGKG